MTRPATLCFALVAVLSACVAGDRIEDPSPQATLADDLNEPTDGFANEVGTE